MVNEKLEDIPIFALDDETIVRLKKRLEKALILTPRSRHAGQFLELLNSHRSVYFLRLTL